MCVARLRVGVARVSPTVAMRSLSPVLHRNARSRSSDCRKFQSTCHAGRFDATHRNSAASSAGMDVVSHMTRSPPNTTDAASRNATHQEPDRCASLQLPATRHRQSQECENSPLRRRRTIHLAAYFDGCSSGRCQRRQTPPDGKLSHLHRKVRGTLPLCKIRSAIILSPCLHSQFHFSHFDGVLKWQGIFHRTGVLQSKSSSGR